MSETQDVIQQPQVNLPVQGQQQPTSQIRQPPPGYMGGPPPMGMYGPPPMGMPPGPGGPMPRQPMPPGMMPPPQHQIMQKIMEEPLLPKNPTLYIQNLNERVKIPDLKNALFQLFSNYGEVVEVHAKKNIRSRGQAHVVFQDEESAESALQTLRGYNFFGKPLRINYSKKQSDVIAKMKGIYEESEKAKRSQRRVQELKIKSIKQKKKLIDKFLKMRHDNEEMMSFKKAMKGTSLGEEANNTLFIEGLSKITPTALINDLFVNLPGFKEVRHIIEKQVAFAEFEQDDQAAGALQMLNGYNFKETNGEQTTLRITFAKR